MIETLDLKIPEPEFKTLFKTLWDKLAATGNFFEYEVEPEHLFEDGLYHRKITIPAGLIAIGRVHREEHFNVIAHGSCLLWTSDQPVLRKLTGPCSFVAPPGCRKAIYVLEEITWCTSHVTDAKDVPTAEERLLYPKNYQINDTWFLSGIEPNQLEGSVV